MEAYPQKVREQILLAYEEKSQTAEIAEMYQVSRSWARRNSISGTRFNRNMGRTPNSARRSVRN